MATLLPIVLQLHRALDRIATATRGELLKRATDLVEVPWVREACWHAGEHDWVLLGRFDLLGPDGRTPWPSVLVQVRRRPRHHGQADRKALIAVYVNPAGAWEVSVRESEKIPRQYRGDPEGAPSVLNGDRPADCKDYAPEG